MGERVHRDHRAVRGRAVTGGRHPRGPRAGSSSTTCRPLLIPKVSELASSPGSSIAKVVLVVGTGPVPRRGAARPSRCCERPGRRACASCSWRPRPTCWCAATRAPAAATRWPASRSLAEAIEAERRVLGAGQGRGRRGGRHLRPQRAPAAGPHARPVRRRGVRTPACRPRSPRSATSTACPSTPTW